MPTLANYIVHTIACLNLSGEAISRSSQYSTTGGNIVGLFLKHTTAFVTHMVNPLLPHGLFFPNISKGSFICTIPVRITHNTAFVTPVVEHWMEREIAQWVHHEGSIRRPIAPWANALTTELHLALLSPQVDTISCGCGIWTEWSNLQHGKRVDKENESAITRRNNSPFHRQPSANYISPLLECGMRKSQQVSP